MSNELQRRVFEPLVQAGRHGRTASNADILIAMTALGASVDLRVPLPVAIQSCNSQPRSSISALILCTAERPEVIFNSFDVLAY